MTETLAEKKCTPCRGGIAPLTHEEAERFRSQTPAPALRHRSAIGWLRRNEPH
jgi:4a-hydroxytetrahydrobiopterin dehydratase